MKIQRNHDRSSDNLIIRRRHLQRDKLIQNRPRKSRRSAHIKHNIGILSNMFRDNFLKPIIRDLNIRISVFNMF